MQKIIFNADDLGWSKGVNEGIVYCYHNGVVNSASLMTTTSYFEDAVQLIEEHKLYNIGIHINLTEGRPLIKNHQTLVDAGGNFFRNLSDGRNVDMKEVYLEIEAQYQKAVNAGIAINHIDSHHHIHMSESLRRIFTKFSKTHKLPIRKIHNNYRNPFKSLLFYRDTFGTDYYTSNFTDFFYGDNADENKLLSLLDKYRGQDIEIMCHPGYTDDENGIYNEERYKELKVLTGDRVISLVKR